MQVGCCCPLPSAGCCVYCCAQGLCNMSLQPGRYSLVSLTDLTSQQIHRCLLYALHLVAGRMLLSSAICRLLCLLLCTGFVQHVTAARQVQPGLFDRLDTSQQMHRCLLVCLESVQVIQSGCLLLSAGCCAVAACTGFVQHVNTAVTGCKVCFTDPTHQNNRAREL
jgi:hypothetical protein